MERLCGMRVLVPSTDEGLTENFNLTKTRHVYNGAFEKGAGKEGRDWWQGPRVSRTRGGWNVQPSFEPLNGMIGSMLWRNNYLYSADVRDLMVA